MAGVNMNIQSNINQVVAQFRGMPKRVVTKAVVTALNKIGKEVTTEAKRQLADKTGLKKGTVAKRIKMDKASRQKEEVTVRIGGRWLNLIEFGARETKRGVSHKAWGRRQVTKGAFFFKGSNSGKQLVGKKPKGTKTGKRGKPILERRVKGLVGAHIPTEFFRGDVDKILKRKIASRFNKLLATALDFQFSKELKKDKVIGRFLK
tara:strand:- start:46 stop:660 length:615 start_codon:yes stop_codon:yes gene_type:complete